MEGREERCEMLISGHGMATACVISGHGMAAACVISRHDMAAACVYSWHLQLPVHKTRPDNNSSMGGEGHKRL